MTNRLLRNERDGRGKYRVFNTRKNAWVEDDAPGEEHEHFVVMLKDKYARAALLAYATSVSEDGDTEYAKDVMELANRAGPMHKACKTPDP